MSKPKSKPQRNPRSKSSLRQSHYLVLVLLLIFPTVSIWQVSLALEFPPKVNIAVLCYFLVISLWTFLTYRKDKKNAKSGRWRTPEARLHFLELIGGWPGAFLAQRAFRHKIAKGRYQVVFWLIILGYEALAVDHLFKGPVISGFLSFL